MKHNLLVSFSGGETSAYMAQWLWNNKHNDYNMIFVFANTGQESEETLLFVDKCSVFFGFPIVWVEAKVHKHGTGNTATIVNYETASRDGQPFEAIIKKHGIPNQNFPHCSRELKKYPINSYARSIGWKKYLTAIGIRIDEIDRINDNYSKLNLIYPLIHDQKMTKEKINFWWSQQPFRLNLRGYQGNCVTCWKKSDHKLYTIAQERERDFTFFANMELKYGKYTPESRLNIMAKKGILPVYPINFFRKNRSAEDIINESRNFKGCVIDDNMKFDQSGIPTNIDLDGGSCEIYADCGE